MNRLTEARRGAPGYGAVHESFTYGKSGNIETQLGIGTYTYGGRPQLPTTAGEHSFQYDAVGNMVRRTGPNVPGADQRITYTAFDMPRTVSFEGGTSPAAEFEYDAAQTRVVKRTPSATTYYAGDLYREHIPAGAASQQRFAVYAGGRQVAELARSGADSATELYAIHADALGSTTAVTTSSANFAQQFSAFGKTFRGLETATGITAGFTSHENDSDLGLINMRGRVYDPIIARFLTADPVMQSPFSTQGLHRFSYVTNAPTTFTDPSGWIISPGYPAGAVFNFSGAALGGAMLSLGNYGAVTLLNIGLHEALMSGMPQPGTVTVAAGHVPTTSPGARGPYDATSQSRPSGPLTPYNDVARPGGLDSFPDQRLACGPLSGLCMRIAQSPAGQAVARATERGLQRLANTPTGQAVQRSAADLSRRAVDLGSRAMTGVANAVAQAVQGAARGLAPALKIAPGNAKFGIEHIVRRHAFNTVTTKSASKFSQGMGHVEIRALVEEAARSNASGWVTQGSKRVLETNVGRTIGTGLEGEAVSGLRIVTSADGTLITAYPIPLP